MGLLTVHSRNEQLFVVRRDREEVVIQADGVPVSPLLPGWVCDGVLDNFAPIYLMPLRHFAGAFAVWILDASMQRIAISLASLPETALISLRQRATAVFRILHDRVLAPVVPVSQPEVVGLESLSDQLLGELISLSIDDFLADARIAVLEGASGQLFGFSTDRLKATLDGDVQQDYLDVIAGRGMSCSSPDTGRSVAAQIGMVMPDRSTMYRFPSTFMGAFYIVTRDYFDRKFAFYVPHVRLYVVNPHASDLRTILTMLLGHAARQHARLCAALTPPVTPPTPATFVMDYPILHLGHVIWNDLTGLEQLTRTLPEQSLPQVVVINPKEGSEPFGLVDRLFPEFAGRVRRPNIEWDDAAAYIYDNNLFVMRLKSRYVTTSIGERVFGLVEQDQRLIEDRVLAQRIADTSTPCILLGLRVGNRTLQDQIGFLSLVVEHLIRRLGRITIVLDGINSRIGSDPTTSYGSFGPLGSVEPLIEELSIVIALRRRFETSIVTIVSTVGCTLTSSLFWASHSHFFVAPWGAALAKYRWLCNLPGFVVTNRFNIGMPTGDLKIYHDPEFMQNPSEMRLVALESILDAPGPSGFYSNFSIDPDAARAGLDSMIELTRLATLPG